MLEQWHWSQQKTNRIIAPEQSSLIWVLQQSVTQWLLKRINQFIHAALQEILDMFTGGEQTSAILLSAQLYLWQKPLYAMTETCLFWLISLKGNDGWWQWFPGRSASSVFHLAGRGAWSCHFHLLHYFLFSSTPASSRPKKMQVLCCNLCTLILSWSTLVPHFPPVHE